MKGSRDSSPLIAHVIFRLGVGGLENGLVNLINHLPAERYRHAIVCLTDATDFRQRIRRADVGIHELHRREGHDLRLPVALFRLFRVLRPAIVHTRNLAALESQAKEYRKAHEALRTATNEIEIALAQARTDWAHLEQEAQTLFNTDAQHLLTLQDEDLTGEEAPLTPEDISERLDRT